MAKNKRADEHPTLFPENSRLTHAALRRRRHIILPRYLRDEAQRFRYKDGDLAKAYATVVRWADLETGGHLERKETALDADFLNEVFGEALSYRTATQTPQHYNLERQFSVPGVGTADGALGHFGPDTHNTPVAVIELKPIGTDLDRDKFNGRTPVQQCWDYLNALPDCPWGIVSDFRTLRLYHRDKTPLAFEHFTLQDLRQKRSFLEFWVLLGVDGLLPSRLVKVPTALRLLRETDERQRAVGDELYEEYRKNRLYLIEHLHRKRGKSLDVAISIAQKIMDRIIFLAFCEDRGLLPSKIIQRTYEDLPPFTKVTNPRWRNFLDLFRAVDQGHRNLNLETGYDGGLFQHDPEVDDLQLEDDWTGFFRQVSVYDFRDEVNVDVLGHLFEKSVTELERLRHGGLFEIDAPVAERIGKMRKSAQRKRFGIYYTPPDFTKFIVESTVGQLVEERLHDVARAHDLDPAQPEACGDAARVATWAGASLDVLRGIKVCDPACGSGAFLIQAYDLFERHYEDLADTISAYDETLARELAEKIPDIILADNLFGVDVSLEAVEITQLALWVRSARRGKTLADLSNNIVCGNSLVTDSSVHPRAMTWQEAFPSVFSRTEAGFDCVVSNPPWERLKLQEREFFAFTAPEIAEAVSAARRRSLIARLDRQTPALHKRYTQAKEDAEATLMHLRTSGEFPLTAKGDINTYMLFAELGRKIAAPNGRAGMLVPSGIASDKTTKDFFNDLVDTQTLGALYDFENKEGIFPDVHRSLKFCTLFFGGSKRRSASADFVFFVRNMDEALDRSRHVSLNADDLALLNPNTRTCPIFRSRRDAELTKAIYRRVPILVDEARGESGNPWGIRFFTMFHQTNDAELFHTADELKRQGFRLEGNQWVKGKKRFLPLYEAKMVQAYDHRAASVVIETDKWMRQGQTVRTSLVAHQNSDFVVQPRWWVDALVVTKVLGGLTFPGYVSYKDVTSPTNERTMIAAFIPHVGVVNSAPLVLTSEDVDPRRLCCLLANLNSFVLDYVARQKVGNVHLNFFIVKQFPMLSPDRYDDHCPWNRRQTLERWVSDRVLKLTCTAEDMRALGEACGLKDPVRKWKPTERAVLTAELDAAYFHLYGVNREDAEYILSTFTGTRRRDETDTGRFSTAERILEAYDTLAQRTIGRMNRKDEI